MMASSPSLSQLKTFNFLSSPGILSLSTTHAPLKAEQQGQTLCVQTPASFGMFGFDPGLTKLIKYQAEDVVRPSESEGYENKAASLNKMPAAA